MAVNPNGLSTNTSTLTTTKLDELINGGLEYRARQVVAYFAYLVLDLAQGFVPVDTGHLKASLQIGNEFNVYDIRNGGLVAIVGTSVFYAVFVEFGTIHMSAQPFLTPSVELLRDKWATAMSGLFGDEVVGL